MAITVTHLADALKAHRGLNDEERELFNDLGLVVRVILAEELRKLESVGR
jgi:hypothetical protein